MNWVPGRTTTVLLLVLASYFILGIVDALYATGQVVEVGFSFLSSLLVAQWCYQDSLSRPVTVTRWNLWLLVLAAPLGLLVYLFRSRSIGRAAIAVAKAIAFVFAMLASYVAGIMLIELNS